MKQSKVKIIDWVGDGEDEFWEKLKDGQMDHLDYKSLNVRQQKCIENVLVDYIIEHKLLLTGSDHQNKENCIPVVQYGDKSYYIAVSMRRWGDIMARAWSVINNKKYMSMDKFWKIVNKEKKKGAAKKSKKYKEGEYYNYLDFAWDVPNDLEYAWKLPKDIEVGDN